MLAIEGEHFWVHSGIVLPKNLSKSMGVEISFVISGDDPPFLYIFVDVYETLRLCSKMWVTGVCAVLLIFGKCQSPIGFALWRALCLPKFAKILPKVPLLCYFGAF